MILLDAHGITDHLDTTIPLWGLIGLIISAAGFLIGTYYLLKTTSNRSISNQNRLDGIDNTLKLVITKEVLEEKLQEIKETASKLSDKVDGKATYIVLHKEIEDLEKMLNSNVGDDKKQDTRMNEIAQGLVRVETEVANLKEQLKQ